ncbi:hypothetical protein AHiyo8_pI66640 (plasmid) [Arthrobacter sp. Hiyo8]|nr:hypothetical protein AHiyo8_pI66640 [Arthrobacter sp. Hiyo8]
MSQSTERTTESNPFTKPGFILAAALVVALIAAALVIFLLPKGQDNTPAARPGRVRQPGHIEPSATAAAGQSICGLPAASESALGLHRRRSGNSWGPWLRQPIRKSAREKRTIRA